MKQPALHRRPYKFSAPWFWSFLALLAILGASQNAMAQLRVVTTLPDLAAIAQEVGGDAVEVTAMARPSQDPHYVDARPNYIVLLNRADLLLINGLELEVGWLPPLQTQARNPKILTGSNGFFDASRYVKLLQVTAAVDRAQGDIHVGGNPHFTRDPRAAIAIARALQTRLTTLDPTNANQYQKNTEKFTSQLTTLVQTQIQRFAKLSPAQRSIVVYHQSMPYLLDWLGLQNAITIEPKPGIPPNPGHVAKVLTTMRVKGVNNILQEEYYPRKTSQTLAKMTKGEIVVIEGGVHLEDGQRYSDYVQKISDKLYNALSQ